MTLLMVLLHSITLDFSSYVINLKNISEEEILIASQNFEYKFTNGSDNIQFFMVKDCIGAFLKPLLKLFNMAVSHKTFADRWKLTRVYSIHKSGDLSNIKNYKDPSWIILQNYWKLLCMPEFIIVCEIPSNHINMTSCQRNQP